MNDEQLYNLVVEELRKSGPRLGLWAKAFADANGKDSEAKALYLKYRVNQLREEQKPRWSQSGAFHRKPLTQRLSDAYWTAIGIGVMIGLLAVFAIIDNLIQ